MSGVEAEFAQIRRQRDVARMQLRRMAGRLRDLQRATAGLTQWLDDIEQILDESAAK